MYTSCKMSFYCWNLKAKEGYSDQIASSFIFQHQSINKLYIIYGFQTLYLIITNTHWKDNLTLNKAWRPRSGILIRSSHFTTQEPYIVHLCDFPQKVPIYLTDILVPFSPFNNLTSIPQLSTSKSYMYNFNKEKKSYNTFAIL